MISYLTKTHRKHNLIQRVEKGIIEKQSWQRSLDAGGRIKIQSWKINQIWF
jgi:hypothetical protein